MLLGSCFIAFFVRCLSAGLRSDAVDSLRGTGAVQDRSLPCRLGRPRAAKSAQQSLPLWLGIIRQPTLWVSGCFLLCLSFQMSLFFQYLALHSECLNKSAMLQSLFAPLSMQNFDDAFTGTALLVERSGSYRQPGHLFSNFRTEPQSEMQQKKKKCIDSCGSIPPGMGLRS